MIQGHAYHAWVVDAERSTTAYRFTRLLGTLPLPAFLVLAGASLAWRVRTAAQRGEHADLVRRGLVRRGLQILAIGYLVNALSMLADGGRGLDSLLRADVLHVIGLSIAGVAWIGVRAAPREVVPSSAILLRRSLVGASVVTLLCVPLSTLALAADFGGAKYLVAPFVEVVGVTQMPFVPLFAWCGAGVGGAAILARLRSSFTTHASVRTGGLPAGVALGATAILIAIAAIASSGASALVAVLGGAFDRTHPAVILNVVDLAARGGAILALGAWLAPFVHRAPWLEARLLQLGRGSLVAYVVHVPFCYGAFGEAWRHRLSMGQATLGVIVLTVGSFLAVLARDYARDQIRRPWKEAPA
jgi:hypothetical protein